MQAGGTDGMPASFLSYFEHSSSRFQQLKLRAPCTISAGEPLLSFGIPIQIATESGNFEMAKLLYEHLVQNCCKLLSWPPRAWGPPPERYGAELPPKLVAATSLHSPFPQVAAFVAEAGDCFAT